MTCEKELTGAQWSPLITIRFAQTWWVFYMISWCFSTDELPLIITHFCFIVTGVHVQGRNEGEREAQFPGRQITAWARKSPNNVTSTFVNTVHLLPKDLRFEHGGAKLASCPGRHLTSLHPCSRNTGRKMFVAFAVSGSFLSDMTFLQVPPQTFTLDL